VQLVSHLRTIMDNCCYAGEVGYTFSLFWKKMELEIYSLDPPQDNSKHKGIHTYESNINWLNSLLAIYVGGFAPLMMNNIL